MRQLKQRMGAAAKGVVLALSIAFAASSRSAADSVKFGDLFNVQVNSADGRPLSRAIVVRVPPTTNVVLEGLNIIGGNSRVLTDADGRFNFFWNGTNTAVLIADQAGFCLAQTRDLMVNPVMTLRPWGRIEGVRLYRGQPAAGQNVRFGLAARFLLSEELAQTVSVASNTTMTDANGRFVFDHVPPAPVSISAAQLHPPTAYTFVRLVDVTPGGTNHIEAASDGRTITGHVTLPPGLTNQFDLAALSGALQPDLDVRTATQWPVVPAEFDTMEERPQWLLNWHESTAGRLCDDIYFRLCGVEVHSDGTFMADLVKPGNYWMHGSYAEGGHNVVTLSAHIEIPSAGASAEDAPYDVGKFELQPAVNLPRGAPAPDFKAETLDGNGSFKLSDYRGKYVLLDFWATWSTPSLADISYLETAYQDFGARSNFFMASLSLDFGREAPKKFIHDRQVMWKQLFLGDWTRDTVMPSYGLGSIPQIVLIDPDGRIVTGLHGPQVNPTLARLFNQAGTAPKR